MKDKEITYKDYVPRDVSWMFFNRRILQEAMKPQGRRITLWHQFSKERTIPSCSLSFCLHAALSFILFYPC